MSSLEFTRDCIFAEEFNFTQDEVDKWADDLSDWPVVVVAGSRYRGCLKRYRMICEAVRKSTRSIGTMSFWVMISFREIMSGPDSADYLQILLGYFKEELEQAHVFGCMRSADFEAYCRFPECADNMRFWIRYNDPLKESHGGLHQELVREREMVDALRVSPTTKQVVEGMLYYN